MRLFVVGLGIKAESHITKEVETVLRRSDKVFYLSNNDLFDFFLESCNKKTESLAPIYFSESHRYDAYRGISTYVFESLKKYKNTCLAIYGHPNFFVQSTTMLSRLCNENKIEILVLPGISSLDCMMVDLGINLGDGGAQIYDCSELLLYDRYVDQYGHLVILQVGVLGEFGHSRNKERNREALIILQNKLKETYNGSHKAIFYRAGQKPRERAVILTTSIEEIHSVNFELISSLYIPPANKKKINKEIERTLLSL